MIYWIDKIETCLIGISAKPKGFAQLENEIAQLCGQNINLIVSLLELNEMEEFGLIHEECYCKKYNIKFESLPIRDNFIPGLQRFADKIDSVFIEIQNIDNLLIHCSHGLGRSGLFVAGLLLKSGINQESALKAIELKRGFSCPTSPSQLKFIKAYDLFLKKSSKSF